MIRTKSHFAGSVLLAMTALLHAQAPMVQAERSKHEGSPLVGAWVGTFVVTSLPPGVPSPTQYALTTFSSDGLVTAIQSGATPSNPVIQNLGNQLSAAVGEWVRLDNRQFMQTIVFLIFKDGVPAGFQRSRITFTLSESLDSYAGTGIADFLDLKGNIVTTGTANVAGDRVTWH
jgi:hypothetical protein